MTGLNLTADDTALIEGAAEQFEHDAPDVTAALRALLGGPSDAHLHAADEALASLRRRTSLATSGDYWLTLVADETAVWEQVERAQARMVVIDDLRLLVAARGRARRRALTLV